MIRTLIDPHLTVTDERSVNDVLSQCSQRHASVIVVSPVLSIVAPGRFTGADDQAVSLRLQSSNPIRPRSLCCVSYNHDARGQMFLSTVLETNYDATGTLLRLKRPDVLAVAELRSTFRVPVASQPRLQTRVLLDENRYEVQAIDICLNGIAIEVPGDVPSLSVDDPLRIEIVLDERETVQLAAVVRNRRGSRIGIFFPETVHDTAIEPPDELRSIVAQLELEWLQGQ